MQLLGRCSIESHTFAMNLRCRHTYPANMSMHSKAEVSLLQLNDVYGPPYPSFTEVELNATCNSSLGEDRPRDVCDRHALMENILPFLLYPSVILQFLFHQPTNRSCRKACQHADHRCYGFANCLFESIRHLASAKRTYLRPRKPACYHHMPISSWQKPRS